MAVRPCLAVWLVALSSAVASTATAAGAPRPSAPSPSAASPSANRSPVGHELLGLPSNASLRSTVGRETIKNVVAARKIERDTFRQVSIPRVRPATLRRLPAGIPDHLQRGFDTIHGIVTTPERMREGVEALKREVVYRQATTGESHAAALEHVLSVWENKGGFEKTFPFEGTNTAPEKWNAMLRRGALFRDDPFHKMPHGMQSHRIQWNVIIRHAAQHPEAFASVAPAEFYKFMGTETAGNLDWSKTGVPQPKRGEPALWGKLFDSYEKNFTSPEFLKRTMKTPSWGGR